MDGARRWTPATPCAGACDKTSTMKKTAQLPVRCSEAEIESYKAAADRDGPLFSEWVRQVLNEAAAGRDVALRELREANHTLRRKLDAELERNKRMRAGLRSLAEHVRSLVEEDG